MLSTACWILRLTLAGQCLGVAVQLLLGTYESEADVYGLLFFDLNWPEATALAVEDFGTWAFLAAGAAIVIVPLALTLTKQRTGPVHTTGIWLQILALAWIALWQATLSGLHVWRGGSFMVEWTIAAHAVRIFSPLALIMLLRGHSDADGSHRVLPAEWILRLATAATFAVHGLEAFRLNPHFVDLLIGSARLLPDGEISQSATTPVLRVIGVVDGFVAVLIIFVRSRTLAAYMAFWGLVTACSRMTAGGAAGLSLTFDDTLIRLANGGAPLALLALWSGEARSRISIDGKDTEPGETSSRKDTSHDHVSENV